MSWQLVALNAWLRLRERPRLAREASVELARARMERMAALAPPPAGAGWRQAAVGVAARRMPGPDAGGVLLWFHGGAYCLGSSATHAAMVTALAERADAGAVVPDYRLAPEHPFPAAVEDARAAWDALVKEVPAERIGLGGDSAGGGLAFALLQELLAEGLAAPACVVAFSPWTDLTLAGRSLASQAWREVLLPPKRLEEIRNLYLAGADPRDPRASPRHGRYKGAPPVLIQASMAEILRDDAQAMAETLRRDGVPVTLDLRRAVPHVWQAFHGRLPEADAALDRAAAFLRAHLKTA